MSDIFFIFKPLQNNVHERRQNRFEIKKKNEKKKQILKKFYPWVYNK